MKLIAELHSPWKITDGRQGQRTPIVALQILFHNVGRLGVAEHPVLTAEAVVLINNVIEAPVPVKDHQ